MFNTSLDNSLSEDLKPIATTFTITTILLACLTILFDFTILLNLIRYGKLKRGCSKSRSRRIGLVHSVNTYIHIIGNTTVFLIMSCRTLFGDVYFDDKQDMSPSWHCRLLNYLISMFAAGIYGSCFLQALFRFWRILKPHERIYKKFSFHLRLIFLHWTVIIIISIPVWFRSVYLSSENYCLNRFNDAWTSVYISLTSVVVPICGVTIVYFKIVLHMKHHWRSRKRWRRMKREILTIKRIILLVGMLLTTSSAAIILWLLMFIQKRMHPLSYRLLCFMVEIGMLVCSITLSIASPQLRRALRSASHHQQPHQQRNSNNMPPNAKRTTISEESTAVEETSTFL